MKKYTCILVDDENLARELLVAHISKIPHLEILAAFSNAVEARMALTKYQPDILFLDIQMPDITGLELLRMLHNRPAVILTTAYAESAVEGFSLDVTDYLLKPIEFERFFQAVSKAVAWLDRGQTQLQATATTAAANELNTYFFVKSDQRIVKVDFQEILFIEALQKYVCIHTISSRIITLMSMSQLEEVLPAKKFTRIHRSFIININKIDSVEGNVVHIGKHDLPLSKGQREAFMEILRKNGSGW